MPVIQIRDVPEEVRRALIVRAAQAGTSLSDYLLREVTRLAETPTPNELDERIRARGAAGLSTADLLGAREDGRRR